MRAVKALLIALLIALPLNAAEPVFNAFQNFVMIDVNCASADTTTCDIDHRIKTGTQTGAPNFGPFQLPKGSNGIAVDFNPVTATGGVDLTGACIMMERLDEVGSLFTVACGQQVPAGTTRRVYFGPFGVRPVRSNSPNPKSATSIAADSADVIVMPAAASITRARARADST